MSRQALIGTSVLLFASIFMFLLMVFSSMAMPSLLWQCFKVLYIIALHYIAFWYFTNRFLGTARATSILVNISLAVSVTIITLLFSEYALRFAFREVTTTGDNLSYFSKKWGQTVHYNQWGFREKDFDTVKPNDTYRIAVIGDSLTFGQGIKDSDRFSNLLEEKLNQKYPHKYQVLNFGLPGAETTDEIGFLTRSVLVNKPDFIILQWFINDVEGDDKRDAPRPVSIIPNIFRQNSALFYLTHRELSELQTRLGLAGNYEHYMLDRFSDPNSGASRRAVDAMNSFIEKCREANIALGIVLFSESYYNSASKLDFLLERMLFYCKEKDLRCVDTRRVLAPMHGDPSLWASRFDPHPSAVVNRLVADQILEAFGDQWSHSGPGQARNQ